MITGGPIPLDRVAGLNGNGARDECVSTVWFDRYYRRRRPSEVGKKDDRESQQAASNPA